MPETASIGIVRKEGNIKYALSGDDPYVASVSPGETIRVECAINVNDGTIRHPASSSRPKTSSCRSSTEPPDRSR